MSAKKTNRRELVLRIASLCALLGLGLIVWSVLDPRALPVLVALSIGQGIGTASFLLYLIVVASDLGLKRRLVGGPDSVRPPPPESSPRDPKSVS